MGGSCPRAVLGAFDEWGGGGLGGGLLEAPPGALPAEAEGASSATPWWWDRLAGGGAAAAGASPEPERMPPSPAQELRPHDVAESAAAAGAAAWLTLARLLAHTRAEGAARRELCKHLDAQQERRKTLMRAARDMRLERTRLGPLCPPLPPRGEGERESKRGE